MISVARVWRARERIEREAAALFSSIADNLEACDEGPQLVAMARSAAVDEIDHAKRCRAIVDALAPGLEPFDVPTPVRLGPTNLSARDRVLYETVAMGCVTESLSCGLLLAMRTRATHSLVVETIQHILTDEVQHSRIGWAHLAHAARTRDVTWLTPHIAPMVRAALTTDIVPMCVDEDVGFWRSNRKDGFGVLTRGDSTRVVADTVREVIVPGLAAHGISVQLDDLLDGSAQET